LLTESSECVTHQSDQLNPIYMFSHCLNVLGRTDLYIMSTNRAVFVGFEVLTPVVMNTSVFWDTASCTQLKVTQRFREPNDRRLSAKSEPQNMTLTSPTRGGRSVGIVRLPTKTTEFSFSFFSRNGIFSAEE
jgi:hypothetical protein